MDELVKRLWECASGECFNCSQYTKTTNASVCSKELMKQAADAIEELQGRAKVLEKVADKWCEAVPKWIPVTERLPEEDGCYLVAVKNDHQRRYSKTAWFSHGSWFARQDVTHWMPLPEPPKEG